jgi:diguanylate cyclase (GGDEF)-like protein
MGTLLKHLVEMTGHRDHAMLDMAAISAMQDLADAKQARIHSVSTASGHPVLRARASISKGGKARLDAPPDIACATSVAACAELADSIARHQPTACVRSVDGGYILWCIVWNDDDVVACLEIHSRRMLSNTIMQMIDGVLGVYRNFRNLLDYSERDSLTGLLNRKTFDDRLARMLQSSPEHDPCPPGLSERRQHHELEQQWLAVVDVDHFKAVNDKFGHLYGDEVLILIANLLQSSFRAQDRVFRFGGEEFVVLLRSTTLENAQKIIERFRTNVEQHSFPQVGQVTVSVGFVSINAFESPVVTLGRADQALYYAKSNGRNRACHYAELVSSGVLRTAASNDTVEFF